MCFYLIGRGHRDGDTQSLHWVVQDSVRGLLSAGTREPLLLIWIEARPHGVLTLIVQHFVTHGSINTVNAAIDCLGKKRWLPKILRLPGLICLRGLLCPVSQFGQRAGHWGGGGGEVSMERERDEENLPENTTTTL